VDPNPTWRKLPPTSLTSRAQGHGSTRHPPPARRNRCVARRARNLLSLTLSPFPFTRKLTYTGRRDTAVPTPPLPGATAASAPAPIPPVTGAPAAPATATAASLVNPERLHPSTLPPNAYTLAPSPQMPNPSTLTPKRLTSKPYTPTPQVAATASTAAPSPAAAAVSAPPVVAAAVPVPAVPTAAAPAAAVQAKAAPFRIPLTGSYTVRAPPRH
jgi:hypothetical protein